MKKKSTTAFIVISSVLIAIVIAFGLRAPSPDANTAERQQAATEQPESQNSGDNTSN